MTSGTSHFGVSSRHHSWRKREQRPHLRRRDSPKTPMERRYSPYQRKKSTRKGRAGSHAKQHYRVAWTAEEDESLRAGVFQFGGKKWKAIAQRLECRTPEDCSERWSELQNLGNVVKRPWTAHEDREMTRLVSLYGPSKWAVIASYLLGRNGKQCRERWHNQLNPAIKKGPWTKEEDEIILDMQARYGNCWAKITAKLPGRTDNAVKNHWHSSMKAQAKQRDSATGATTLSAFSSAVKPKTKLKTKRSSGRKRTSQKKATRASKKRGSGCERVKRGTTATTAANTPATVTAGSAVMARNDLIQGTFPTSDVAADRGSLSPESVSNLTHLDQRGSWNLSALPDVELVDSILDPLGMGSLEDRGSDTHTRMAEQTMDTWYAGENDMCFSATPCVDPTSPTQYSTLDPDHLLYDDPLHELCGGVMGSAGLVLSTPMGEVAKVYQRSMLTFGWASTPPTPSTTGYGFGTTPVSYATPELLPMARLEDSIFSCKEEEMSAGSEKAPSMGFASVTSARSELQAVD